MSHLHMSDVVDTESETRVLVERSRRNNNKFKKFKKCNSLLHTGKFTQPGLH